MRPCLPALWCCWGLETKPRVLGLGENSRAGYKKLCNTIEALGKELKFAVQNGAQVVIDRAQALPRKCIHAAGAFLSV